jgi:hypothetical protein
VRAKYHAHHDHARSTLPEAVWIGIQGGVLIGTGFSVVEAWMKATAIAGGVLLVVVAIGLARAEEWARWTAGLIALGVGGAGVALTFSGAGLGPDKLTFCIVLVVTGAYLLLPTARDSFRNAREARERTRAAREGSRQAHR